MRAASIAVKYRRETFLTLTRAGAQSVVYEPRMALPPECLPNFIFSWRYRLHRYHGHGTRRGFRRHRCYGLPRRTVDASVESIFGRDAGRYGCDCTRKYG